MAEKACHVIAFTTQVGLIQALAAMELAQRPQVEKKRVAMTTVIGLGLCLLIPLLNPTWIGALSHWALIVAAPSLYGLILYLPLRSMASSVQARDAMLTAEIRSTRYTVNIEQISGATFRSGIKGHADRFTIILESGCNPESLSFVPPPGFVSFWGTEPVGQRLLELARLAANNSFKPKPLRGSA